MKNTIRMMAASLALSLCAAAPAMAQDVPVREQKRIEKLERFEKGKAKAKKDKANKGKAKANKGKAGEAGKERGADRETEGGFVDEMDRPRLADKERGPSAKTRDKMKGKRLVDPHVPTLEPKDAPDRAGATPDDTPHDETPRAGKRRGTSAKGLTRLEKENRKHLRRLAQFNRLEQIAAKRSNSQLLDKVSMLRDKEAARHARALGRLDSPTPEADLGQ